MIAFFAKNVHWSSLCALKARFIDILSWMFSKSLMFSQLLRDTGADNANLLYRILSLWLRFPPIEQKK